MGVTLIPLTGWRDELNKFWKGSLRSSLLSGSLCSVLCAINRTRGFSLLKPFLGFILLSYSLYLQFLKLLSTVWWSSLVAQGKSLPAALRTWTSPGLGRSLEKGISPLQCAAPGSLMDRRSLVIHGVAKAGASWAAGTYTDAFAVFCQWSCWFPASDEKQFSGLPNLFFTLCCVANIGSNTSWVWLRNLGDSFWKMWKSLCWQFDFQVPSYTLWWYR